MSRARITVITPSLNQGRYLERAICSVLDQGCEGLEYMVMDGGSSDESPQIIRQYAEHLAAWESRRDGGPGQAINKALSRATGEVVTVLPADDVLLPGAVEEAMQVLGQAKGCQWVAGGCLRLGENDQMLGTLWPAEPSNLAALLMHNDGRFFLAGTFFRQELIRRRGGFDPAMSLAFDYEYWARLWAADERPQLLRKTVAGRREHAASLSATQTLAKGLEYIGVARRYADHLPLAQRCALWQNCECRQRIYALAQAELLGPEARAYLWQQLLRHPWWFGDQSVRHTLLHGVAAHVMPTRPAGRSAA